MATSDSRNSQSFGGNSTSKRLKLTTGEVGAVDRISALPDSLLLRILSFLPTKDVVAIGVLSKRWQLLWTNVPSLDFDENYTLRKSTFSEMNFGNVVNRVLLEHNAGSIHRFRITCGRRTAACEVESWIKKAISRNVQELDISHPCLSPNFPRSVFTCKTLVVLKLNGRMTISVPRSASLPNLKTLVLFSVLYQDDESVFKLISCCSVLENLSVRRTSNDNVDKFRISAPALKCLKIDFYMFYPDKNRDLCINAPALEIIDIKDRLSNSIVAANLGSLKKAIVCLYKKNSRTSFIKALHNVKLLSLSGYTSTPCDWKPGTLSRQFCNLTQLTIGVRRFWRQLLPDFLQCSKALRVLRLTKDPSFRKGNDAWNEPKITPRCLYLCLREFWIEEFSGSEDELGMLKYILKNGFVLKTVEINYSGTCSSYESLTLGKRAKGREFELKCREFEQMFHIVQKILKFPRGSRNCEITFSRPYYWCSILSM